MGMQVCMDSSDWLQGVINDESAGAMDSAISSPSGDNMLACAASRPVMERRLRPQHDQALKCPRCESTHTKFCYYNNYSLSQPRYFCKTCRRYWTKGGTLRNIPVGGGCRKNKKVTAKKPTNSDNNQAMISQNSSPVSGASSSLPSIYGPNDLHLTFPELQLSHMYGSLGSSSTPQGSSFLESKFQSGTRPIDFLESKFDHHHHHQAVNIDDATRSQNFLGNGMIGDMNNASTTASPHHGLPFQPSGSFFNGLGSSFGISSSSSPSQYGNAGGLLDTCQRLMLPSYDYQGYDEDHHHHHHGGGGGGDAIDVKPLSSKLLSLDWQDHHQPHQSCLNGVGPWSGMMNMNPYGPPSTTNPLV